MKEDMEDILRKLVAFHTTADDPQATHEALDYIADFVTQRGMHVERYDYNGAESLVATVRPNDKSAVVMLAAHLDVVPAPDEQFTMQEKDGNYLGRGVLDMKSAIAGYLQFVDDHQETLQNYDFCLLITSDEEHGGDSVNRLLAEGYRPKVCVLPDGGDNWQIQVHSKGFCYYTITTHGVPAHGSRPWLGKDALQPMIDLLTEVRALFPKEFLPETSTLNIGQLHAGNVTNQIPDRAEASLDIRIPTETERSRIKQSIQAICAKYGAELNIIMDGPIVEFSLSDPYIAPFAQSITEVTGIEVVGSRTLGSNDARYFLPYDIPCISFYLPGGGHHGPEEWISKQSLFQYQLVLEHYMAKVAKAETPARVTMAAGSRIAKTV